MAYSNLKTISITINHGIAHLTINHPPINLFDELMAQDLDTATQELAQDSSVQVIIIQSAIPEFFIAHSGLARVAGIQPNLDAAPKLRQSQIIGERFRTMNKVSIAKVTGRARGGGNEIVLAADMAFASPDAIFGQPEVMVGIVPGGGSTQRLPPLIGRSRALEVLLGGQDFTAAQAEQ